MMTGLTTFVLFISFALTSSDNPKGGGFVDFDATIRIKGSSICKGCSEDKKVELSLLLGKTSNLSRKVLGKYYFSVNKNFEFVDNYYWGQQISTDEKIIQEIQVFFYISECQQKLFEYQLEKLPFDNNERLIDLGQIDINCDKN